MHALNLCSSASRYLHSLGHDSWLLCRLEDLLQALASDSALDRSVVANLIKALAAMAGAKPASPSMNAADWQKTKSVSILMCVTHML